MKIDFKICPSLAELEVSVLAPKEDEQAKELLDLLEAFDNQAPNPSSPERIIGFNDKGLYPLELSCIAHFYTQQRNCFAQVIQKENHATAHFRIKERIGDLEQWLDPQKFVRVNQSEIVQIAFIERFVPSGTSSIELVLLDGTRCYVSRRMIAHFKKVLGI